MVAVLLLMVLKPFFNPNNNIDIGNKYNTYLNLKNAGASTDWCFLRQVGGDNAY